MSENITTCTPELDPEGNYGKIEDVAPKTDNPALDGVENEDAAGEGDAVVTPEGSDTDGGAVADGEAASEPADAVKPKAARPRKTKKSGAEAESDGGTAESEAAAADDVIVRDVKAAAGSADDRAKKNAARRRERARKLRMEAPLDADGRPIVDGDGTFDSGFAEISQKRNTREVVSGYIDEVKMGRNGGEGWVEVMYNDFRVLIPFSEMDVNIEAKRPDETDENYTARHGRTISNMIGARIEFVISGVESAERLAAGSRLMATRARRRSILDAQDRDGNYIIYPGRKVSANVLAVHKEYAFLDVYGMRVRLRAPDIRADYVNDVNDVLENGMTIPVYITHIARNENGEVTQMFISCRDDKAEKEKLKNAAVAMKEGDLCRGRISARTKDAIFITLSNGLQAYAYVSNGLQGRKVPNIGDNVSLRVIRVNENRRNRNPIVLGKIIRNINYAAR